MMPRLYVIPNNPEIEQAVVRWLQAEGYLVIVAYRPGEAPKPPSPPPTPPTAVEFPVGTPVKVKYNAWMYYDPDARKPITRTLTHPQYGVLAVQDNWRLLSRYPPYNIWALVEDLEAA